VLTTYSITLASGLGGFAPSISDQAGLTSPSSAAGADVTQSAKQKETRYTMKRSSAISKRPRADFACEYVIHFTSELQNGTTNMYQWDVALTRVPTIGRSIREISSVK